MNVFLRNNAQTRTPFFSLLAVGWTVGLLGCSSPQGKLSQTDRKIASVKDFYVANGAACLAAVPLLFSPEDESTDQAQASGLSLEDWVQQGVAEGAFDPRLAAELPQWSMQERTTALALSLAEALDYGNGLTANFDAQVRRGLKFETIRKSSDNYDRLRALYFVRNELIELVGIQFRRAYRERAAEEQSAFAKNFSSASRGEAMIDFTRNFIEDFHDQAHAAIDSRIADERYSKVALEELDQYLSNAAAESTACLLGARAKSYSDTQGVIAAAASMPRGQRAYRRFQPARGARGFTIEKLVSIRAKRIADLDRSPQSITEDPPAQGSGKWGKFYTPSTGKVGNVTGGGFPKGVWALTFDDGPIRLRGASGASVPTSEQVLGNLKRHGIRATFFILSQQIDPGRFADIAKEESAQGHAVESHSYTHPQFLKISATQRDREVNGARRRFNEVLGFMPHFFRLPYGQGVNDVGVRKYISDAGMVHVFWNVDTLDWQDKVPSSILARALGQMRNNGRGVILFHDVHTQSVTASELVMRHLKDPRNGLRTVTIPGIVDELNGRAAPGAASE